MNLKINHRTGKNSIVDVKYFNSFSLNLKYDSIASTFSFNFYFDPKNHDHAELACVSHFHECIVEHNGETLLTGFLLSQVFNQSSIKQLASFGGYSKPGVLEDCDIPTSLYPLQSDGRTLREIAQRLISPFNLKLVVDDFAAKDASSSITHKSVKEKSDTAIPKTTAKESKNIKSYLTELATQQNIVLSHNEFGNLVLSEANTKSTPLIHFENDTIGTDFTMSFNGQGIHSHITVIKEASADGGNAGEYTIRNPFCPVNFVYRPKVIVQSSGDDNTVQETAANALAAELKNIVLTVTINRWDINNKLIRPNNTITITSPELFLYKKVLWFIESVDFKGDEKSETAVLTCVLPSVYDKSTPVNIFVDPHQNLPRF